MKGEQYLTKPYQYAQVYSKGTSRASKLVVMRALSNNLAIARYGFSVSRRVGNAVTRNKVKRLLREVMRELPLKSGWDIVFIARPPVADADYASLKAAVEELLYQAGLVEKGNKSGVQDIRTAAVS